MSVSCFLKACSNTSPHPPAPPICHPQSVQLGRALRSPASACCTHSSPDLTRPVSPSWPDVHICPGPAHILGAPPLPPQRSLLPLNDLGQHCVHRAGPHAAAAFLQPLGPAAVGAEGLWAPGKCGESGVKPPSSNAGPWEAPPFTKPGDGGFPGERLCLTRTLSDWMGKSCIPQRALGHSSWNVHCLGPWAQCGTSSFIP